jgi:hypothetical protein
MAIDPSAMSYPLQASHGLAAADKRAAAARPAVYSAAPAN